MADTVERLPFAISERLASLVETVLSKNGREIHYTVGGIPFRLHVQPDTPMTIETAQQQKNQQDVEPDPGEQTLSGWWLRSQSSWHEGAGQVFMEPRLTSTSYRVPDSTSFRDSQNIDVWTQGEAKLLRRAEAVSSGIESSVFMLPDQQPLAFMAGQDGAVVQYADLDTGSTFTSFYEAAGITFVDVVAVGNRWYAVGSDGKVYSSTMAHTTTPDVWTLTGAIATTRLMWAKHRLWAVSGNSIYWVDVNTPGTTASPKVTGAVYTHPSIYWRYTDIADINGSVLFAGYGDGTSHLQKIDISTDSSNTTPTLTAATTTAIMPSDEIALRVASIAGDMVGILTTRGFRVAQVDANGDLVYGPLFLERDTTLPVSSGGALATSGRFWWASWGDEAKVWRIDSSVQSDDGVFAYASDMNLGASGFADITMRGERPVVVTAGGDLVYRHATELEPSGYLQMGRVRFRTEEPKKFQFVNVSAEALQGSIQLDVLNEADTPRTLITYNTAGQGVLPTAEVPIELGPLRFMSVKLTLNRATDVTAGPVVHGVQLKALPAAKPQRIYTLPLDCYDRERWSTGMEDPYGYDGFARDRYMSVRAAEDAGGVVVLRDYRFPQNPVGELCKIESLKFVQQVQGDPNKQAGGFGGILVVTLRTLT